MDISKGYLVLDVETTGLNPFDDRIIEVGVGIALPSRCLACRGLCPTCIPELELNVNDDCAACGGVRPPGAGLKVQSWLIRDWTAHLTPENTAIHGITAWEAARLGIPMTTALDAIEQAAMDLPIVAHNGLKFDLPFIDRAYFLVTGSAALANPSRWIDTAALYKGFLLKAAPMPEESHQAYARRILDERHYGLRFNLAAACEQFGFAINPDEPLHRTGTDVKYTAMLLECLLSHGVAI